VIPLLRAQIRALVADPAALFFAFLFPFVPAFMTTMFSHFEGASSFFLRVVGFGGVFGLGGLLRGRASTPSGIDPLAAPMPTLPVRPNTRVAASALLAETLLVAVFLATNALARQLFGDAPPSNPFAGLGLTPNESLVALPPLVLTWLPVTLAGARLGNALTPRALLVGTVVLFVALGAGADRSILPAIVWAFGGSWLAMRASTFPIAASSRAPATRPGLGGLLGSMGVKTGLVVLCAGGVGFATGAAMGAPQVVARTLVLLSWTIAALLPLLPAAARGARLAPRTPEALFLLPVSRVRTLLAVVGAHVARGVGTVGIAVAIQYFGVEPIPAQVLLVGALALITSTASMGVFTTMGGVGPLLGAWILVAAGTGVTMLGVTRGGGPAWILGGQALVLAVGGAAALVSSGRLGFTGRSLA
jgi:hypothetical protein